MERMEEDKLVEDGSRKLEDISSATDIQDVYAKYQECLSRLKEIGLVELHEILQEDFTVPEDDEEIEFLLPLFQEPCSDEGDETNLCLIFNYTIESGVYSIFADVDFFPDDIPVENTIETD